MKSAGFGLSGAVVSLRRLAALAMIAAVASMCLALPAFAANLEEELKLGKEAAAEVEKQSKFIKDEASVKRVEDIGTAVAKAAGTVKTKVTYGSADPANFTYTFKIIEDKDINAFSLPGGYVYVNKGLLDYVQSDDELAAVIAHEIAHIAHHHAMQLLKTQQKTMLGMAAVLLLGAAVGVNGTDLGDLAYAANLVSIAKMSAYGQKAEYDADRASVAYLTGTKYSPVGMLTFMERLARDEGRKPTINYGILATHPKSYLRAREIIAELQSRKITINRRLVTSYLRVQVKPVQVGDKQAADILIGDIPVIRMADANGQKAAQRAEATASKLEAVLLAGAQMYEVKVDADGRSVTVRGDVAICPTEQDAAISGKSLLEVATSAKDALKKILWKESLDETY